MKPRLAEPESAKELLRKELERRGWSQKEFAAVLGKTTQMVSGLVLGKNAMTPATALALEAALDVPAETWLLLQEKGRLREERTRWRDGEAIRARRKAFEQARKRTER